MALINAAGPTNGLFDRTLKAAPSVGATSILVNRGVPTSLGSYTYVVIDAFTSQAELRKVNTSSSGRTINFTDALRFAHHINDIVLVIYETAAHAVWWAVKNDGSDVGANLNLAHAELDETREIFKLAWPQGTIGTSVPIDICYAQHQLADGCIAGYGTILKLLAGSSFNTFDQDKAGVRFKNSAGNLIKRSDASVINTQSYLNNLLVDCNNLTGGNGILSSHQQPASWGDVRVDNASATNCYGFCANDGQDLSIDKLEAINCYLPVDWKGQDFLKLRGLNIETSTGPRDVWIHAGTSGGLPTGGHVLGGHFEPVVSGGGGAATICFDIDDARGISFMDITYSCPTNASNYTVFDIDGTSSAARYEITGLQGFGGTGVLGNLVLINDQDKPEIHDAFYNAGWVDFASNGRNRRWGSGTPESVITAPVGTTYARTNGGAGTSFYVKESGTGNTGWVAK